MTMTIKEISEAVVGLTFYGIGDEAYEDWCQEIAKCYKLATNGFFEEAEDALAQLRSSAELSKDDCLSIYGNLDEVDSAQGHWPGDKPSKLAQKVIMINDSDGHGHVVLYNQANMRKLLETLSETDWGHDNRDEYDAMLAKEDATAEEIEAFLRDWKGPVDRACGGMLHFVELKETWDFAYNPLQ